MKPFMLVAAVPTWPFVSTLVIYAVAALLHVAYYARAPRALRGLATGVLSLGFAAHSVDISARAIHGVHPGSGLPEALSFMVWFIVLAYLLAHWRYRLGVIGAFVAPLAVVVLALARISPSDATQGISALGRIHIAMATLGVAIFAVATGVSCAYLLEDRALRAKRFEAAFVRRGVALDTLETLTHRLVSIGFPVFSAAMMLGVVWAAQRKNAFSRPEYPLALATWAAFALVLVARTLWGVRGRRSAWLVVGGFCAALGVLSIYFLRRLWS